MTERFTRFTMTISRLNKQIQKLKTDGMGSFGLKAVDTLCLYQLDQEESMSFSQLAQSCQLDQALVSRTLRDLVKIGMVEKDGQPGRYNARYSLTPAGAKRTQEIRQIIQLLQVQADQGICEEDLAVFYRVLEQLSANFEEMVSASPQLFSQIDLNNKET